MSAKRAALEAVDHDFVCKLCGGVPAEHVRWVQQVKRGKQKRGGKTRDVIQDRLFVLSKHRLQKPKSA